MLIFEIFFSKLSSRDLIGWQLYNANWEFFFILLHKIGGVSIY